MTSSNNRRNKRGYKIDSVTEESCSSIARKKPVYSCESEVNLKESRAPELGAIESAPSLLRAIQLTRTCQVGG